MSNSFAEKMCALAAGAGWSIFNQASIIVTKTV